MTQTAPDFTLPIARATGLYRNGLAETLTACCTPVGEAGPGDILGLVYNFHMTRRGMLNANAITQVLQVPTGKEEETPRYADFAHLTEKLQARIALACMKTQSSGISFVALEHFAEQLDPDTGEEVYFDLLITPEFCILDLNDYDTLLYEGKFDGEARVQAHIDQTFKVLVPKPPTSNHELPTLMAKLEAFWTALAPIYAIPGDDGEDIEIGIGDLRPLISQKS